MIQTAQRIVIVISSLGGGGAERVVVDLSEFLMASGREVIVLTLSGEDPDWYRLPAGIQRERMEIRRPASSLMETIGFTLSHLLRMRRRILGLRPDVVLSFVEQTNVRVIASLFATGIPVIASERVHPAHHLIGKSWEFARRLAYRLADGVVVQSADIAAWFAKWLPVRRLIVIPNAVRSAQDFSPGPHHSQLPSEPIILGIGRLNSQKGFDLLLEAFARSELPEIGWRLIVLGEGPAREQLTKLAGQLGISNSVAMPGHVANVAEWLARAEIFALSSRYEGFPNALLEAMQTGKASVSFDCPSGPRDIIQTGRNGILVQAGDVLALAEALHDLARDGDLRRRLGSAALAVNAEYAPSRVYGAWVETIDATFKGRGRGRGLRRRSTRTVVPAERD